MRVSLVAVFALAALAHGVEPLAHVPPKSPAEEAKTFQVLDGFRMELLAAEPLVASPVAMTYDENGRAYVCEMRDYPYTDKAHHKAGQENPTDAPIGQVRLLVDTDGDGVFDQATVFADGLSWPTGVACWKGGVYVAATPDLWYFKDTDGDGVADERRKVFTGFRKLNVQAVMNNLVWGLDNRIHGAGGSNGGELRAIAAPETKPLVLSHADYAFDPRTEKLELLSGGARFGGSFDDWGHRFLCNIRNPAQHIVLPNRYLARNPFLAARSPLNDMAEAGDQLPVHRISEPEPWRVLRAKRWAGERDIVMPRSELVGAGVVTSASGVTSYRGAAYPEKYRANVFVCECAGNLFYRLQLTPDGPTFKARRVDGDREMVASTDNWFRPVNFVNAPDGTLHVLDMYRENIEHPWSIPEDIHAAVDLEAGRDMGRVWRLAPPGFKTPAPPKLGSATTPELVAALENPNSWWRETAQRLLIERQDKTLITALREMLKQGRTPQARLHALWTLDGLSELTDNDVLTAIRDSAPGLRENALRLAEPRLMQSPKLSDYLLEMANSESSADVLLQTAFTLGEWPGHGTPEALATIAKKADDPWTRTAILSSTATREFELIIPLLYDLELKDTELISELAKIVGLRGGIFQMNTVVEVAHDRVTRFRLVLTSLGEGLKRSNRSLRQARLSWEQMPKVERMFEKSAQEVTDASAAIETRVDALKLLACDEFERVRPVLEQALDPRQPQELQRAAVAATASFQNPETAQLLLKHWNAQSPGLRSEVVLAMLGSRTRVLPLLEAVERGDIAANQVPFSRRALLLRSTDEKVKILATKLFAGSANASRSAAIEKYQASLAMKGDPTRGRKIFETACAICHRFDNLGNDVGPNLATIRQWNPDQVLINILDPNREVAPNFSAYLVETKDGRTLDGMIAAESAASVTLKRAGGVQETVLRSEIAQVNGLKQSLMPEGLEAAVSVEQMADLIAFLLENPPAK